MVKNYTGLIRNCFVENVLLHLAFVCTGCGRNNSHILKVNKHQTKQGTRKIILFIKSTYDAIFSNAFKDNIAQVPAVIDDKLLKPFTEVVHGFAGHRGRNGGDFLSYCLL